MRTPSTRFHAALAVATILTACSAESGEKTDGGQPDGGDSAALGSEGAGCLEPEGTCLACTKPGCDDGLACHHDGPAPPGNYGTCLPEAQLGEACEVWGEFDGRGTCGKGERDGSNLVLQCCGTDVESAGGTCAFFDDPICDETSDCAAGCKVGSVCCGGAFCGGDCIGTPCCP